MTAKPHGERRQRTWRFQDMYCDHVTGKLRESALFSIAGKAAILVEYCLNVTALQFETMTLAVAAIVIGHDIGNRFLNLKTQKDIPSSVPAAK